MSITDSILYQAIEYLTATSTQLPASETIVEALVQAEKVAKHQKFAYRYDQLVGTWQLGFVTGTKQARSRAGVMLGSGRFIPRWIHIQLTYTYASERLPGDRSDCDTGDDRGCVMNSVKLGALRLTLSGPAYLSKRRILAFDFSRMTVHLFGLKLYDGFIRGGAQREGEFYQQTLKDQAFFSYFWLNDRGVAARGRGGGLALWTKVS